MAHDSLDRLRDMLMREVEKIAEKNDLNENSLIQVDKLTHSIKSIDTILAMRDAGYSEDYGGSYGGNSYARRYARRDNRGRYSREDGYARRGGYYSREDGKEDMMHQLREMMENAPDEITRQSIQRTMNDLMR